MLQRQLTLSFFLLSLVATTVQGAETAPVRKNDFSYTYVDLGYNLWEYDFGANDRDADALFARGSYAVDEHFSLRGGLSFYSGDRAFDGQRLSAGAGFNTPLKDRLDLVVTGDLVHDNNDIDNENGLIFKGGVRHSTTTSIELGGGLFYENIYSDADDLGLFGRSLFRAGQQVDLGADLRLGGDIFTLGLFGRYHF